LGIVDTYEKVRSSMAFFKMMKACLPSRAGARNIPFLEKIFATALHFALHSVTPS
jgi:hypothetical protein